MKMSTTTPVAKYRSSVGALVSSKPFVGEAGLETSLIFENNIDLPCFAAFPVVLKDKDLGVRWQQTFFENAKAHGCGYWLDTKTWRANPDYGEKLKVNLDHVWKQVMEDSLEFRKRFETSECPIIISGVVGPRRDGYRLDPSVELSVDDSKRYHRRQIQAFSQHGADVITAYTMNHLEEPAGIALVCKEENMPCVISFTVETNGKLASGASVADVIRTVDDLTDAHPLFYMLNCAHPSHMENALRDPSLNRTRIRGYFPNSSRKSHAELDEATTLDRGEPGRIGSELHGLLESAKMESPFVVGGCCGTSIDHVKNISDCVTKQHQHQT